VLGLNHAKQEQILCSRSQPLLKYKGDGFCLLSTYCMPGALHEQAHLTLPIALGNRWHDFYFTEKEAETQSFISSGRENQEEPQELCLYWHVMWHLIWCSHPDFDFICQLPSDFSCGWSWSFSEGSCSLSLLCLASSMCHTACLWS
jgi:hypothetical protein